MFKEIKDSKNIRKMINDYYVKTYLGVVPGNKAFEIFISQMVKENQAKDEVEWIKKMMSLDKNQTILDYGCGIGNVVVYLGNKGYKIDGFEVDSDLYKIVRARVEANNLRSRVIKENQGNRYKYNRIVSIFVAEHVNDLYEYILKAINMLQPGGEFLIITCNYKISWEYHYQLFLPLFSKKISKLVLRIIGRKTDFLDGLLFVKPSSFDCVFNRLAKAGINIEVQKLGEKYFIESISQKKYHSKIFMILFSLAKTLHLVKILVAMGLYNPLIYKLKKI